MDKIILGMLMLKRLNVYEIRTIIKKNFKAMCSDSMGSIQASLKKLLGEQMITYQEYVEKSVNKKQYSITDKGRKALSQWLHEPAALSNPKNMELGKLLFMGLVPADLRCSLVSDCIALLEKSLTELLEIKKAAQEVNEEKDSILEYWEHDAEYLSNIQNATQAFDLAESAKDINEFQMLTLQYGIDCTQFQIDWCRALENKLKNQKLNGGSI